MVEQVTGRMTRLKAALAGAASGAWFGLLAGLLLGFFALGPAWLWLLVIGLLTGAVWGAMFGFLAQAARYQAMTDHKRPQSGHVGE